MAIRVGALAGLFILLLGASFSVFAQCSDLTRSDALFEKIFVEGDNANDAVLREARAIWERLADEGNSDAQYYLSFIFFQGLAGAKQDEEYAVRLIAQAAEGGNSDAQYKLAHTFEFGQVNKKSDSKAVEWYQRSADLGNWLARERLKRAYTVGELGLPVDLSRAASFDERSNCASDLEHSHDAIAVECTD